MKTTNIGIIIQDDLTDRKPIYLDGAPVEFEGDAEKYIVELSKAIAKATTIESEDWYKYDVATIIIRDTITNDEVYFSLVGRYRADVDFLLTVLCDKRTIYISEKKSAVKILDKCTQSFMVSKDKDGREICENL